MIIQVNVANINLGEVSERAGHYISTRDMGRARFGRG